MAHTVNDHHINNYRLKNAEFDVIHYPYVAEQAFFDPIRRGDLAALEKALEAPHFASFGKYTGSSLNGTVGLMSANPEKQAEYSAVLAVTMAARAAIDGGLDPEDAYDMNDLYLQQISLFSEYGRNIEEYSEIVLNALRSITSAVVRGLHARVTSIHVRDVKNYISKNLGNELTVRELAQLVGVTPNYLSAVFCKEEGKTISAYILDARLEAAAHMLRFTDLSLSAIAEYTGFHSLSYFCAQFKKKAGVTPARYRKHFHVSGL